MQIICETQEATIHVLLLFMHANLWPIHIYGTAPDDMQAPPFIIPLPRPLDATLRTQIEQIPDTQVVD